MVSTLTVPGTFEQKIFRANVAELRFGNYVATFEETIRFGGSCLVCAANDSPVEVAGAQWAIALLEDIP